EPVGAAARASRGTDVTAHRVVSDCPHRAHRKLDAIRGHTARVSWPLDGVVGDARPRPEAEHDDAGRLIVRDLRVPDVQARRGAWDLAHEDASATAEAAGEGDVADVAHGAEAEVQVRLPVHADAGVQRSLLARARPRPA